MCLIAFAIGCHPIYSLVLAANRDEYRSRPTEPAGFWTDAPHALAGRDQQAGGTWLGVTTSGKFAAVTNYRDVRQQVADPPSRGMLVADYLRDPCMTSTDLQKHLLNNADRYDGFNLLYGSVTDMHYFTNRGGTSGPVKPGIHSLSNHLLDTNWPKSAVARERLTQILHQPEPSTTELLMAMTDKVSYEDSLLPDTGIGLDLERFLSPIFINGDTYGTRSTTVVLARHDGTITFAEQSYDTPHAPVQQFSIRINS